jgi:CHAD domain-containing protein
LDALSDAFTRLDEGGVNALHQARVATRRLRELVPVLGLESDATEKLVRRLRKTTRRLGAVRELDVMAELVEELRAKGNYAPEALDALSATVARERASAAHRLRNKLSPHKRRRLTDGLEDAVERMEVEEAGHAGGHPVPAWRWALQARVARRAGQLRAALDATCPMYRSGQLHDARIALKKLRYGIELSLESGLGGTSSELAALKAGQDALGRLHDLEVLIEWSRDAQASSATPGVAAWRELGSLMRDLENECRRIHARYMSSRERLLRICDRSAAATRAARPARPARPTRPTRPTRQRPAVAPLRRAVS